MEYVHCLRDRREDGLRLRLRGDRRHVRLRDGKGRLRDGDRRGRDDGLFALVEVSLLCSGWLAFVSGIPNDPANPKIRYIP